MWSSRLTNSLLALVAVGLFLNVYHSLYNDTNKIFTSDVQLREDVVLPSPPASPQPSLDDDVSPTTPREDPSPEEEQQEQEQEPQQSPRPSPPPLVTTVECRQLRTLCEYRNLCFDSRDLIVLADDREGPVPDLESQQHFGFDGPDYMDHRVVEPKEVLYPYNSGYSFRAIPASKVFGPGVHNLPLFVDGASDADDASGIEVTEAMTANGPAVAWLNGSVYVHRSESTGHAGYNLWHWSVGTLPVWAAQISNLTFYQTSANWISYDGAGGRVLNHYDAHPTVGVLPPMDYLISLSGGVGNSFTTNLLRSIVPDNTKIIWNRNLGPHNYDMREPEAGVGNQTIWRGLGPILETEKGNLGLTPGKRILCAKRAVLMSRQYTVFNDALEWRTFRRNVLLHLNLHTLAELTSPPPVVVFKASGRNLRNLHELVDICRKYTTCKLTSGWNNGTPFSTQVEEVAGAGIFVGVHGAGMANAMFLPPGGVVMELFPFKWWPDMYRRMASEMRAPYFMVATYERPPKQKDDGCANQAASSYTKGACAHGSKYEEFWISRRVFERTLIDALQLIGVNAVPEGNEIETPTPTPASVTITQ